MFRNFLIGALRDTTDPIRKAIDEPTMENIGLGGLATAMAIGPAKAGKTAIKPLAEMGPQLYKNLLGLDPRLLAGAAKKAVALDKNPEWLNIASGKGAKKAPYNPKTDYFVEDDVTTQDR